MTPEDEAPLLCWCGEEPAVPGSFLGLRCLPEPEPAPEDEA